MTTLGMLISKTKKCSPSRELALRPLVDIWGIKWQLCHASAAWKWGIQFQNKEGHPHQTKKTATLRQLCYVSKTLIIQGPQIEAT